VTGEIIDRIVLASASPRRYDLLRSLGLEVERAPSGYGEPSLHGVTPETLAAIHARAKLAAAIARGVPQGVAVVAADTVVDVDGEVLGKPLDAHDAARMLAVLSGREHRVHTAFSLRLPGRNAAIEEIATTTVGFYALSADEIATYVASGEPFDKAGGYGIQGRAAALVARIAGDFYTVMGFPLARFVRALRRSGFSLPAAKPVAP